MLVTGESQAARFDSPGSWDWVVLPGISKGSDGCTPRNLAINQSKPIRLWLDLANLLVHIDVWRAQGVFSAAAASTAEQAILDTASAMNVSHTRMHAYSASTRLRLACLYAFRPSYQAVAHFWFERLEEDFRQKATGFSS
ncbi:hypothetical protein ACX80Z_13665 [Arthrobacter sp. TMT4-20]